MKKVGAEATKGLASEPEHLSGEIKSAGEHRWMGPDRPGHSPRQSGGADAGGRGLAGGLAVSTHQCRAMTSALASSSSPSSLVVKMK
jgi:hypothetical protein